MTALEKTDLARFLDMAAAVTGNGYQNGETGYQFEDDSSPNGAVAPDETAPSVASTSPTTEEDTLESIAADVRSCTGCQLCQTRKNAVPGEGVAHPLVMVIGEGPGADEDASGRPFVGRAGQLLDKMLASIRLSRENNCFIANVIKCRPPANRDPQPMETAACASYLKRQIQLLSPRFILCAGRISAQTLLGTKDSLSSLRGKFIDFNVGNKTIPLIATYHPSALLRNEENKRPAWEDLKLLRAALDKAT